MMNTNIYRSSFYMIISIVTLLNIKELRGQYYQGGYNPANYGPIAQPQFNQYSADNDEIEQKYVNSGQSIMLVCDLPNNMPDGKVLFVKYDSKVLSSGLNIIDDIDDDRFEIGQQYAWEWSLKINSINEDDAGLYFCKVGFTTIKKYEVIVRVPPRIRDDGSGFVKTVREGDSIKLSCFANGTPKPNITWFTISPEGNSLIPMKETGSFLNIQRVSRTTPRRYQCRAANYIPPSDTRNYTLSIEFAPEISIDSRLNRAENSMELNCTIRAYPLTNRKLVSHLTIKYYNELDQGLYECTAENDFRVSKMVYTLKDTKYSSDQLMPIGYSNNYRGKIKSNSISNIEDRLLTTTRHYRRRKFFSHKFNRNHQIHNNEDGQLNENSQNRQHLYNRKMNRLRVKNEQTLNTPSSQLSRDTTNSYNSPYIILIDDYADEKRLHSASTAKPELINAAPSVDSNLRSSFLLSIFLSCLFCLKF